MAAAVLTQYPEVTSAGPGRLISANFNFRTSPVIRNRRHRATFAHFRCNDRLETIHDANEMQVSLKRVGKDLNGARGLGVGKGLERGSINRDM